MATLSAHRAANLKKSQQLGMNHGKASGQLLKSILFKLVSDAGHKCFRCGGELARDTFSIDHKDPWLDTENPALLFFDLDNIAFSHRKCNSAVARRQKPPACRNEALERRREYRRKWWKAMPIEKRRLQAKANYLKNTKPKNEAKKIAKGPVAEVV